MNESWNQRWGRFPQFQTTIPHALARDKDPPGKLQPGTLVLPVQDFYPAGVALKPIKYSRCLRLDPVSSMRGNSPISGRIRQGPV